MRRYIAKFAFRFIRARENGSLLGCVNTKSIPVRISWSRHFARKVSAKNNKWYAPITPFFPPFTLFLYNLRSIQI